jgi:hypothetical protein
MKANWHCIVVGRGMPGRCGHRQGRAGEKDGKAFDRPTPPIGSLTACALKATAC